VALGWTSAPYKVTALSVAAVVCISASNGGTISQDLKTGYLVGATPWKQEVAILIGAFLSAIFIGYIILALNDASTVFARRNYPGFQVNVAELTEPKEKLHGSEAAADPGEYHVLRLREPRGGVPPGKYLVDGQGRIKYLVDPGVYGELNTRDDGTRVTKYPAPQAGLMALIIEGIIAGKLPWSLVLLGVFIAIVLEMCAVSSLAFAVGVYLPISTSAPIVLGGLVRWLVGRTARRQVSDAEAESGPGVLVSSGLIAGGAIAGTVVAFLTFSDRIIRGMDLSGLVGSLAESDLLSFVLFLGLAAFLYLVASGRLLGSGPEEKPAGG